MAAAKELQSKPAQKKRGNPNWKLGVSANPGGKTKEEVKVERESRLLALRACPKALKRLVHWSDSDNPKASVAASIALLERGLGKPVQALEVGGTGGAKVVTFVVVHERADA